MARGRSSKGKEIVVFGSDHGGYQLKEMLKKYAEELGYVIMDVGTSTEEARVTVSLTNMGVLFVLPPFKMRYVGVLSVPA